MKAKVLFPFIGGDLMGGSHVSAMNLAASLDRNVFEPHVLCHFECGVIGEYAQSLGLKHEVLHEPSLLAVRGKRRENDATVAQYCMSSVWKLKSVLKRINPAIVHTNEGRMHTNWVLPTKLSGRIHIWHHRQDPTAFGINKLAPLFSDHIVSVSHFSKPSKPIRSVDHKFSVVRSPFDFPPEIPNRMQAKQALISELGLAENAVLYGYFGNLTERKRPVHFVETIAAIQNAVKDRPVHGLLFGRVADEESKLDERTKSKAAELGIEPQIHLMGFRQPIDVCMAGMDALLISALNEPFGRTLIESMYLGTPVIATLHGGNVEAIENGKTGFLVCPNDPAAFAGPAKQLLDSPELFDRVTEAAHKNAAENYGRQRHVESICEIYRKLLQHGQPGCTGVTQAS
ncbi:glycosyltransferase family 4 protein [Ruegeria sp. HKCCD8929]|uniref:glycosyltransferase family 4 protein n=1 Tax=Ruegeria sp. HKCCD8929 TaxID=2683006 RepID=UPI0014899CD5|nr:glycosyltransferase [Ruegeria sp. HKCCD8929]